MRTMLIERQFYKGQMMKEIKQLHSNIADVVDWLYNKLLDEKLSGANIEKTPTNVYISKNKDMVIERTILGGDRYFRITPTWNADYLSLIESQEEELGI